MDVDSPTTGIPITRLPPAVAAAGSEVEAQAAAEATAEATAEG